MTSCLTGLESAVWQLTIFLFICKTDYSKPVKQEVNGTVILPNEEFTETTNALVHRLTEYIWYDLHRFLKNYWIQQYMIDGTILALVHMVDVT